VVGAHSSRPKLAPARLPDVTITVLTGWEAVSVPLLLLLPFIGLLWVPFFNQATPELFGFPFFYWYQIAWVPVTSFLTFIVWRSMRGGDKE
jgi:hypothetical protein